SRWRATSFPPRPATSPPAISSASPNDIWVGLMIGFAAPLFAAFALAAGLVWFLHSRREYRQIVPSLTLCRQLQDAAALPPKARLVPPITLPLVLQLLAVALLTLALTQPFWGRADVPDHLVVVLEAGAAMGASDGQGTLLEAARNDLIADFAGRGGLAPERLSVIAAGPSPAYAAARWLWEEGRVVEALDNVSATDGDTDWRQTTRLVSGILAPDEATEILVVGASPAPISLSAAFPDLKFTERILAVSGDEAGLSGRLVPTDPQANLWTLDGEAVSNGAETRTLTVQYSADPARAPLDWATIDLDLMADGPTQFSEALELPGPGLVTVFIGSDATPRDSRLRFVAEPAPETLDVLYVGDGEQPLLRALNAVDGVRIFQDAAPGDD